VPVIAVELAEDLSPADLQAEHFPGPQQWMLVRRFGPGAGREDYAAWIRRAATLGLSLATALAPTASLAPLRAALPAEAPPLVLTLDPAALGRQLAATGDHPVGAYRLLARNATEADLPLPLWIRSTAETEIEGGAGNTPGMIETSLLAGPLLCDGLGDLVSAERFADPATSTATAFNILQGTRARITRTEYVACPSCGRTLFDLESTTAAIREKTDHLKGVTIAVMGCIVNGPGEMADADFGYVGGAPGKINLYVGKECVQVGIPQAEAVDRLIALIHDHGKWVDPPTKISS
jgi:(E)-4-hydroxy-3-methylbut-2-enyl-diphosphate synthase